MRFDYRQEAKSNQSECDKRSRVALMLQKYYKSCIMNHLGSSIDSCQHKFWINFGSVCDKTEFDFPGGVIYVSNKGAQSCPL